MGMLKQKPSRSEARRLEAMLNDRQPIVDKCKDFEGRFCENIDEGEKCKVYIKPEYWWNAGNCPMATHTISKDTKKAKEKKTVTGKSSKRKHRI